jgi:hypothetical protein
MGRAAIVIKTTPLPEDPPIVMSSDGLPREVVAREAGFQFTDHSPCHAIVGRPEDQVNVFRHDHVTKKLEPVTVAHRGEMLDE